jgi:hypothetical protein
MKFSPKEMTVIGALAELQKTEKEPIYLDDVVELVKCDLDPHATQTYFRSGVHSTMRNLIRKINVSHSRDGTEYILLCDEKIGRGNKSEFSMQGNFGDLYEKAQRACKQEQL